MRLCVCVCVCNKMPRTTKQSALKNAKKEKFLCEALHLIIYSAVCGCIVFVIITAAKINILL